jgi:uncharacterized protein (DUF885 family)
MDFWSWRAFHQPTSSDDIPRIDRPADWNPDWSAESVANQRQALAEFEQLWAGLDLSTWPISKQVDYRLIGSALARVRFELDILRSWERNPRFYVYQTVGSLFEELLKNRPFDDNRTDRIIQCLDRIPKLLDDGRRNLEQTAVKPFAVVAVEVLREIGPQLLRVGEDLKPLLKNQASHQIDQLIKSSIVALESFRAWLEQSIPRMSIEMAAGRDAYIFFLNRIALMPFTPEQLLEMGRQEWERSITFETIAQERARGTPELPIFSDQATQIACEENDEQTIRTFLEDHNLLTVPSWLCHYRNLPTPSYLEPLASLGVMDDLTSASRLHEDGLRYLPHPSPDLGYFELSSARDPRPLIVHEGVPGHYFQMSLSWAHENLIRRQYYDSGANEGIGFYAEEMMLQAGLFDESPRTREILYNFMRLRALRVEVDVKLALGSFTIDEATDYLQTKTPMDYETARAEAILFASLPGQAISYQIGKLQIMRFLADARQKKGGEFILREFHDYLWKNGNVPITLLRWEYLELDDEISVLDSTPVMAGSV